MVVVCVRECVSVCVRDDDGGSCVCVTCVCSVCVRLLYKVFVCMCEWVYLDREAAWRAEVRAGVIVVCICNTLPPPLEHVAEALGKCLQHKIDPTSAPSSATLQGGRNGPRPL